jgi:hypothetical protein
MVDWFDPSISMGQGAGFELGGGWIEWAFYRLTKQSR